MGSDGRQNKLPDPQKKWSHLPCGMLHYSNGNLRGGSSLDQQPVTEVLMLFLNSLCGLMSVIAEIQRNVGCITQKVPNVLSRCNTKRRMGSCGRAHPSFGMTPTF